MYVRDALAAAREAVARWRAALQFAIERVEPTQPRSAARLRAALTRSIVGQDRELAMLDDMAEFHARGEVYMAEVVYPARQMALRLTGPSEELEMTFTSIEAGAT